MGQKAIETKERIIKTTIELLQRKSLTKISVREICEGSGIAKGTFYLYFESKDDVAWAIIDNQFSGIFKYFDELKKIEPTIKNAENLIDFIIDFSIQNKSILILIHHVRFTSFVDESQLINNYLMPWQEFIHHWIEKGNDSGEFNVINPEFMSNYITLSIHETVDSVFHGGSKLSLDELRPLFKDIIVRLLT